MHGNTHTHIHTDGQTPNIISRFAGARGNNNNNKSIVFRAGTALDLVSSQWGKNYNGQIYYVTLAQYGGRYVTSGLQTDVTLSVS